MIELEAIKRVFEKDQFATNNGIEVIEADLNYAKCRMEIKETHKNARGAARRTASGSAASTQKSPTTKKCSWPWFAPPACA